MTPSPEATVLRPAEVAVRLGIPLPTLRTWRSRGKGPLFFRIGRGLATTEADLARWINEQREAERRRAAG
jgi:hypothetical protein